MMEGATSSQSRQSWARQENTSAWSKATSHVPLGSSDMGQVLWGPRTRRIWVLEGPANQLAKGYSPPYGAGSQCLTQSIPGKKGLFTLTTSPPPLFRHWSVLKGSVSMCVILFFLAFPLKTHFVVLNWSKYQFGFSMGDCLL